MPEELFNEKQETIFDTRLSKAADNFIKACLEAEGWKKKRKDAELVLIEGMKEGKHRTLTIGNNRQIKYQHSPEKDKLSFKDLKVNQPRKKK